MCYGSRRGFDWRGFRTELIETMAAFAVLLVGTVTEALLPTRDGEEGLYAFRRAVADNRRHWRAR